MLVEKLIFILLKGWDGLPDYLHFFLTSALLFSLAGIKIIVTSWRLNGLFKEGYSVLSLTESYSRPQKAEGYCFRPVTLKLSSG